MHTDITHHEDLFTALGYYDGMRKLRAANAYTFNVCWKSVDNLKRYLLGFNRAIDREGK